MEKIELYCPVCYLVYHEGRKPYHLGFCMDECCLQCWRKLPKQECPICRGQFNLEATGNLWDAYCEYIQKNLVRVFSEGMAESLDIKNE